MLLSLVPAAEELASANAAWGACSEEACFTPSATPRANAKVLLSATDVAPPIATPREPLAPLAVMAICFQPLS